METVQISHPALVRVLVKPGADIINNMTPEGANMLHMSLGVSGEAGELLDAIKRHVIYEKPIDMANVIEELGDLEFYMEGLRQQLGISREETLTANIQKLSKRYASLTYTNQAAQERADKADATNP